ncbi:hypothetical protein B0J13DRAFT_539029 [Dactylonectria estremocensis]|uniref:Uncharacterized protein n=1 Tax=Dactylonectria estremocensis TaxID=1079267 RepID=A0A9P9JBR0_9HYPO|nr:hypothetical protein B0J13DRAFT_539029 [Dactylonectria estremocensis]
MPHNGDKDQSGGMSSAKDKLRQEIEKRVDEAKRLQEKSIELHKQADEAEDPKVAEELNAEAREVDKKAAKLMKTAERLEAGWLQGGAMGTGIGIGIASGIGIAVGSLLTGVVAIPTSGLGMLIGAGTGLVHGTWVKYTDSFSKEEADTIKEEAQQEANKIADSTRS